VWGRVTLYLTLRVRGPNLARIFGIVFAREFRFRKLQMKKLRFILPKPLRVSDPRGKMGLLRGTQEVNKGCGSVQKKEGLQ
jgi:hypothetical protein